jgi:hypothetical protein
MLVGGGKQLMNAVQVHRLSQKGADMGRKPGVRL